MRSAIIPFILALTLALAFPPTLVAQPPKALGSGAAQFKPSELDKFAKAQMELSQIHQKYSKRIQNAEKDKQKEQLKQQATQEMQQVVKGQGLTPHKYSEIARQANQNPILQKRLQERMRWLKKNE